jgi:triacylglycerol esterase/lipase EstA (alpha/beta hydrolase family)
MPKINCLPETKWKHKDHIATPSNIVKSEFSDAYELRYSGAVRKYKSVAFRPKALKSGPVIYIMKDGKPINN